MKPFHIPRPILALIFFLILMSFLAGTLRVFSTAHAAIPLAMKAANSDRSKDAIVLMLASDPAYNDTDTPPQLTSTPIPVSADTTGIIALAAVIVTIILIGAARGMRSSSKKESHQK